MQYSTRAQNLSSLQKNKNARIWICCVGTFKSLMHFRSYSLQKCRISITSPVLYSDSSFIVKIRNRLYPVPRNIRTVVRNVWHKVNLHEAVSIVELHTSTIELYVLLLTCVRTGTYWMKISAELLKMHCTLSGTGHTQSELHSAYLVRDRYFCACFYCGVIILAHLLLGSLLKHDGIFSDPDRISRQNGVTWLEL
jgi:hypothetical protein